MAQLAPPPIFQFFDANGLPLAGGLLYTYAAGTTTPLATYTDSTGGTPNANPVVLDANGECVVWIGSAAYKFVLKDSGGITQWTRDGIQYIPDGSITTVMLADGSVTTVKIADAAVTTVKILDANVTTAKIADNAVTTAKIPDAAITFAKLSASTPILFRETSDPRFGDGPTAFPLKPWSAPTLIGVPGSPLLGDGNCVRWSHNGKLLAVAEQNSELFAIFSRFGSTLTRLSGQVNAAVIPSFTSASAVAFSPDGQYLAFSSDSSLNSFIYVLQRRGNSWGGLTPLFMSLSNGITGLAFHPSGNSLVATLNKSPFVKVWSLGDVNLPWGAMYNSHNGQTISNASQIINYESIVKDPMSAVTTGSSWTFTAYREGIHYVNAGLVNTFTSGSANPAKLLVNQVNASLSYVVDFRTYASGTAVPAFLAGSIPLYLIPGDTINIKLSSLGTGTLDAIATENWVTIEEGDGYQGLKTFTALSNPASIPSGVGKCGAWSPDGTTLAVGLSSLTYTVTCSTANARTGATYTNNGVTFTVLTTISSGTTLLITGSGPPLASGTLTKTGSGTGGGTDDATITYASFTTPSHLQTYSFDGTTLVKFSDPASVPADQVNAVSWSPDGTILACAVNTTPFLKLYTYAAGVLTALANPATLPTGQANGIAFSPDGQYLAVAHNTTPFVTVYSRSGTTFTKLSDPGALPTGNGKSVSWTPDRQYLTVGHVTSPYMSTYQTSGTVGTNAVTVIEEVDLV